MVGLALTSTKSPGDFFPVGTTPVTYTATDAAGRTSTCTFNVVVNDVTNPTITGCPTNITVSADATIGSCGTNVSWTPPTASDNCTVGLAMTSSKSPGDFFAVGTTVVTYTATDASGRQSTCTFNVVVNDVTNPTITGCPSTITINANATIGTCGTNVSWTPPTASDNCTVGLTLTSTKSPGDFFPVGTTPVTYTATDAAGRTTTCSFNVVVDDVTNPTITGCPTTITVNADATTGTCGTNVSWTSPTVSDNCTVGLGMTSNKLPGDFFPVGTTLVTYTATDASGRQSTCSFNVVVNDVTNPVITGCPSNIAVNANAATGTCGTNVSWTVPTASDNCTIGLTLVSTKSPGDFFQVGTTPVTYTATDASGKQSTCTFNVVVTDVTNPIIAGCPSTITVNAAATAGICGTNVTWVPPTATDNCNVNISGNKASGDFFPVGTTLITYTATDASGRTSTCTFNVVVNDITNPVITGCPSTITVNADATTGTCGTIVTWTAPTATDNCVVNMTSNKTPGQFFTVGTTAVTYTATDASGRQATCTFNVVVNDVTNPVISGCPSTVTVNAVATAGTCGTNVNWTVPTVSDNCTPGLTMTSTKSPGDFFPVGTTAVTYTATDASGRQSTCTFNVVVNDVTNPVIAGCPSTITVNADATAGTCGKNVSWTLPTVTDNCLVNMTSNKNPGDFFAVGTTAVTYTATDASGRTATCSFNVVVNDVTNPIITACPSTITVNAVATAGTCGRTVSWTPPNVTDNCVVNMLSNKIPGDFFPVGTTAVTYIATDASGRQSTCTFNVVVNDITNPVIAGCPSTITVNADADPGSCGTSVSWMAPSVTDNCVVNMTSNKTPGDFFPVGTTAVTYTATDASGRQSTCTFNVVVIDATSPAISNCPIDITATAGATCSAVATWNDPTFVDNCTGANMVGTHSSGDTFPLGTTNVKFTVTDGAGNQSICSFNIIVVDSTFPSIQNCPDDISVAMDIGGCGKSVSWQVPMATDNCSVTLTSNFSPGHIFPEGTTEVIYSATDGSGNAVTCSFDVVVKDETTPIVSNCPQDIDVTAGAFCDQIVNWTPPVFTDNCGTPTIVSSHNPNDTFVIGVTTVVYTATDASGNSTTCEFKVTVLDQINPSIVNCPADITTAATATCNAVVTWTAPTVTDNCQVTMTSSLSPGSIFPIGTTVVTYTATDVAGNTATCSFSVTVTDESSPVFTSCHADVNVAAGSSCKGVATWTEATVSDCSNVTLTSTHESGSEFPIGSTLVTYTATDANGKSAICSFNVIVEDKTAPVFSSCSAEIVVDASPTCDAVVNWSEPVVADNCGIASVISSHHSGDVFPVGISTVTYTATDLAGNSSVCEFKVTVKNKNVPIITGCPSNQIIKIIDTDGAVGTWDAPTATADCGQVSLTSNYLPGESFPLGETVVEYKATDDAGNTSVCSFIITVQYEDLDFTITKLVTPDGDGINDEWTLGNIEKFKENQVTVFDRWGSVIYSSSGYNNQSVVWKGANASGGTVPTGTYFYTITVRYREDYVEKKGFIEVVR
jgi:gliding motility-associated-like protein